MTYLLVIASVMCVMLVIAGLLTLLQPGSDPLSDRLSRYTSRQPSWRDLPGMEKQQGGSSVGRSLGITVDKAMANRGFGRQIQADLARANLNLTVSEYLAVIAIVVLSTAIIAGLISRTVAVGVLFGVASALVPSLYVKRRQRQRLVSFNNQLGDSINIMANSLRSGYSLLQAMELISRETRPPMGEEFGRVVREVGLGLSPEKALDNLVARIDSEDLGLMVTAIKVQHEVGGNLARILDTIGDTIRERVRIQGEIKVLTAQQSMAGYIITGLPVALGGFMMLINPTYLMRLFTPGWYICMPIGAVIMMVIGYVIIRRIVAIEV